MITVGTQSPGPQDQTHSPISLHSQSAASDECRDATSSLVHTGGSCLCFLLDFLAHRHREKEASNLVTEVIVISLEYKEAG